MAGEAMIIVFMLFIPLIPLALEAWWFWYWYSYGDITSAKLHIIESVIGTLILIHIIATIKGHLFLGFLFIPIPLVVWFFMKKSEEKIDNLNAMFQEKAEINRLLEIIDKATEPALLYKALVELGDLYVKKTEYEKAVGCYRQADEIVKINKGKGLLGLSFKIQQAEKENRVKKGEIWVCTECSYDNPRDTDTCTNCGHIPKLLKSARADIVRQKAEIKKDIIKSLLAVVLGAFGIAFLLTLIHSLPEGPSVFISLMVSLFIMYIIMKQLITW